MGENASFSSVGLRTGEGIEFDTTVVAAAAIAVGTAALRNMLVYTVILCPILFVVSYLGSSRWTDRLKTAPSVMSDIK